MLYICLNMPISYNQVHGVDLMHVCLYACMEPINPINPTVQCNPVGETTPICSYLSQTTTIWRTHSYISFITKPPSIKRPSVLRDHFLWPHWGSLSRQVPLYCHTRHIHNGMVYCHRLGRQAEMK
jgi:hypothetical protein